MGGAPVSGRTITITVAGAAAPQGSKRRMGNGAMIESSKRVKPWRSDVRSAAEAAMAGAPLIDGPVVVQCDFTFVRPAGHFRRDGSLSAEGLRRPYPYARGDIDKLVRAVLDALKDVVLADDRFVVAVHADKRYGARNEAVIHVAEGGPV